jgi:hypothetical protein
MFSIKIFTPMKKSSLIILIIASLQFKVFAQENINNYKYFIVPTSYSFFNEEDKFQINSLTKFLFNKYGFTAFLQNEELPQELTKNKCLALYVNVEEEKSLFKTKLRIDLKDCGGRLVMSSKVGETREKQFDKAFNLALRDAFETYQNINYKYVPSNNVVPVTLEPEIQEPIATKDKEIERLKEEVKALKEVKEETTQIIETPKVVAIEPELKINETKVEMIEESSNLLYAQPIENGFQVVDTTPKIVMILLETGKSNVYMVKGKNAMVYQEDGSWYLSENEGDKVSVKPINIKF